MKPISSALLLGIFFLFALESSAQTLNLEPTNRNVALTEILGEWKAIDYPEIKISFVSDNYFVVIAPQPNYAVNAYMFLIQNDSIPSKGVAPNWPPYDCELHFFSSDTLEIRYLAPLSSEYTSTRYIRP